MQQRASAGAGRPPPRTASVAVPVRRARPPSPPRRARPPARRQSSSCRATSASGRSREWARCRATDEGVVGELRDPLVHTPPLLAEILIDRRGEQRMSETDRPGVTFDDMRLERRSEGGGDALPVRGAARRPSPPRLRGRAPLGSSAAARKAALGRAHRASRVQAAAGTGPRRRRALGRAQARRTGCRAHARGRGARSGARMACSAGRARSWCRAPTLSGPTVRGSTRSGSSACSSCEGCERSDHPPGEE